MTSSPSIGMQSSRHAACEVHHPDVGASHLVVPDIHRCPCAVGRNPDSPNDSRCAELSGFRSVAAEPGDSQSRRCRLVGDDACLRGRENRVTRAVEEMNVRCELTRLAVKASRSARRRVARIARRLGHTKDARVRRTRRVTRSARPDPPRCYLSSRATPRAAPDSPSRSTCSRYTGIGGRRAGSAARCSPRSATCRVRAHGRIPRQCLPRDRSQAG